MRVSPVENFDKGESMTIKSITKFYSTANLADSIVNLKRQAQAIEKAIKEGDTRKIFNQSHQEALKTTCKALLYDAEEMEKLSGPNGWIDEAKRYAISILEE